MRFAPWKIVTGAIRVGGVVISALRLASKIHDEQKASGKDLDDFIRDKIFNPEDEKAAT